MVYRETPVDARVAELEALIASDPEVTAELARVQREYDQVTERDNTAGPELSQAESELAQRREGGVIATVTGWFGRSLEEHEAEVARKREQHAELTARIEVLTNAEVALRATLSSITAARAELEQRQVDAVNLLRGVQGPDGDAVRALDAEDVRDGAARKAIERVIDLGDMARVALWQIAAVAQEIRQITGVGSSVMVVLQRIDSPLNTPSTVQDRETSRARLGESIEYASERLRELATAYDTTGLAWFAMMPRQRVLQLAASPPADPVEESASVKSSEPLVECVTELLEGLVAVRDQLDAKRVARETQRRELAGRLRR